MIDRTKIYFYYDTDEEMSNVLYNRQLKNFEEKKSRITGEPIYIFNYKNLRVKFSLYSRFVTIDGSWIKLKWGDHICNSICAESCSNLTFTDISIVMNELLELFQRGKSELRFSHLEFALTVNTPQLPMFYVEGFNNIKTKPFYFLSPPRNYIKPLEKYCPFSQYTVKGYDYGTWNGLPGNYLRYEVVFRKMQKVRLIAHRNTVTFSDLSQKQFFHDMANFTLNTYRNTDKQLVVDCRQLKPREMQLFYAGQNPQFWKELRKSYPHTQKKLRVEYLRLYKRLAEEGGKYFKELERLLQSKYEYLISN